MHIALASGITEPYRFSTLSIWFVGWVGEADFCTVLHKSVEDTTSLQGHSGAMCWKGEQIPNEAFKHVIQY